MKRKDGFRGFRGIACSHPYIMYPSLSAILSLSLSLGDGGGKESETGEEKNPIKKGSHTGVHFASGAAGSISRVSSSLPSRVPTSQSDGDPCKNIDRKRKSPAELNRECSPDSRKLLYIRVFCFLPPILAFFHVPNSFLKSLFL